MVGRARASYPEEMALKGEYEPSPAQWVRDQVELYEGSGGAAGKHPARDGIPIIVVTTLGVKSGKIRKIPLMRVEHDGEYALVASKGGAPANPVWYYNLKDNAGPIEIQDGPAPARVRCARARRRRARHVVGARRRRLPALCGVPGEDRSADSGFSGVSAALKRQAELR